MNYRSHYERLIERAKMRVLAGYVENHHIIPRCMGGEDVRENLVRLTAEEHYVAHQLLYKMYPYVPGLAYAMTAMAGKNDRSCRNNKVYGWIRKRFGLSQKGRVKSSQERANIAEAGRNRKPRVFSAEARANMAAARRKTWEERRAKGEHLLIGAKTRATRIKNGTYSFSEEHKAAIGRASKRIWTERKSEAKSDLMKPRPLQIMPCREVTG